MGMQSGNMPGTSMSMAASTRASVSRGPFLPTPMSKIDIVGFKIGKSTIYLQQLVPNEPTLDLVG